MTELSPEEQFLRDKNIVPNISFKDGQEHTVVIHKRKITTITDKEGNEVKGISYLVLEDKTPKRFFTSSLKLAQLLLDVKTGEKVAIKQRKYKKGNEFRTTYEAKKVTPEVSEKEQKKDTENSEKDVPGIGAKEIEKRVKNPAEPTEEEINSLMKDLPE